jgi:hypothetical protein
MFQRSHSEKWAGAKVYRLFEISVERGRGRSLTQMVQQQMVLVWALEAVHDGDTPKKCAKSAKSDKRVPRTGK